MCGQIIRHKELCAPIIKGDLNNGNHMKNNISSVIFIRIEITMFIIDEAVKYPFFFCTKRLFYRVYMFVQTFSQWKASNCFGLNKKNYSFFGRI